MLCLRVAALYNDVRWVFWSVWICFVIFHGIRAILAILGMILVARELLYHQVLSRLISSNAVGAKYSLISSQCLQESGARFHSSGPSILAVITPTTLDLYLLVLTIVKASRSDVLSKSHPSSPIVCVVLDFGFSLETILRPPRCARCCATKFCMWSSEPLWSRFLFILHHRYFIILVSRPDYPEICPQTVPAACRP